MYRLPPFLFLSILLGMALESSASHLRAGEITAERTSCTSLTFRITITAFLDTESGITFGGSDDWLEFGDGEKMRIPEQTTIPRPDLGKHMGMVIFSIEHTYAGPGEYVISYSESFRNHFVVNMDNPETTKFYLSTMISIDPALSCNRNLPRLLIPPVDKACSGVAFFHNPGAVDLDGDSLSFELTIPRQGGGRVVHNYKDPNDRKFYFGDIGDEAGIGPPAFSINPVDGTIKWDAPGWVGEYNIAFYVIEWRKNAAGAWQKMSIVTRDMQIIVEDCENERPDLIVPNDTCVTAGTVLDNIIYGVDPDNDPVKIEVYSEVLSLAISPATYQPDPPAFQSSQPSAQLSFRWQTQCEHVKDQYYLIIFKITDKPDNGPSLVTFKTWRVKVVGPSPKWQSAQLNLRNRSATLSWDPYACANAIQMQVWRRIDGFEYTPQNCETGMPAFLGYTHISSVPIGATSSSMFTDTNEGLGLAPGARYCYRLVAVFPTPKGGESYVSADICLQPIKADAPVITNVTVEDTHSSQGLIRVSWYSPFEINRDQFPGPYEYEVYRASGFDGNDFIAATPAARIQDTTFVDGNIDTEDKVYNYKIVLYSNTASDPLNWVPIDTSAAASSVRLQSIADEGEVSLSWKATVPWLNRADKYPYHLIYRKTESGVEKDFTLIDSVLVTGKGFTYVDNGQFRGEGLNKELTYCYRVLTRGVYGNPRINEPLENFSQIICLRPDRVSPCPPVVTLVSADCNELFINAACMVNDFSNKITWQTECGADIKNFRIYAATGPNKEFALIADNVTEDFFVEKNLTSFARCYKVTAVNKQGMESTSEMVCNDNCPYFELPNIFTPNGDDCNDYFSAYGPFNIMNNGTSESCLLGADSNVKCVRFVEKVYFKVFNRWGKEVYSFQSGQNEFSTYINWDGRDSNGQPLSSGIYYYFAEVYFEALADDKKHRALKGWVHLVR